MTLQTVLAKLTEDLNRDIQHADPTCWYNAQFLGGFKLVYREYNPEPFLFISELIVETTIGKKYSLIKSSRSVLPHPGPFNVDPTIIPEDEKDKARYANIHMIAGYGLERLLSIVRKHTDTALTD